MFGNVGKFGPIGKADTNAGAKDQEIRLMPAMWSLQPNPTARLPMVKGDGIGIAPVG